MAPFRSVFLCALLTAPPPQHPTLFYNKANARKKKKEKKKKKNSSKQRRKRSMQAFCSVTPALRLTLSNHCPSPPPPDVLGTSMCAM